MKIYKYYIIYYVTIQKGDRVKSYFAPIELDLFDRIKKVEPISEMIKEILKENIEDEDTTIGIMVYNWKLLNIYEVNDEKKEE